MFQRLPSFVGAVAVGLLCCFAASSQAPPASAAKPPSQRLPVYTFNAREFLKLKAAEEERRRHPSPCYCNRKDGYQCGDALPLSGRPYFSQVSAPSEVTEIDLDGLKKILTRDPKDTRPLLINFWATWCDGCREEFPDLVKIDNDYRGKMNFVSVTLDEITEINTAVPEFLKKMKAQMPVVLLNVKDPEPAIHAVDATWDGALPATYLYDKDGKVVFKYFGAIKPAELRKAIETQLGSKQ